MSVVVGDYVRIVRGDQAGTWGVVPFVGDGYVVVWICGPYPYCGAAAYALVEDLEHVDFGPG
jgi:hypothetical protein